MSVLKKMFGLLFDEGEPDVYVDDELEPVTLRESKTEKKETEKTVVQEQRQQVQEETLAPKEEHRFTKIEIQDLQPKEQTQVRSRTVLREETKTEFEFQPVISPMFGSSEDEKPKKKKPTSDPVKKQVAKKKVNPLGTVISPYYGTNELEAFEHEAKEKIEAKEKSEEVIENNERSINEEVIIDVPLEEIISDAAQKEEDDLLQYSLFSQAPKQE